MTSNDHSTALAEGTLLQGGRYSIERVLGQDAFGITYLGTQVALCRQVAIKEFFMRDYCERNGSTSVVSVAATGLREIVARFRDKFVREAQLIAGLDHPHIIRIHDIFEEHGTAYYVMEHIAGGSLANLVSRSGHLDEPTALGYIHQVGEALIYLHGQNILHLDIKPSNVLLRRSGEAVLIDFGISKRYDEAGGQTSTTPADISRGYAPIEQYTQGGISKGYAPLEQYRQGGTIQFSPATDVYSLGATFYKLLTGQTPPDATDLYEEGLPTAPLAAQSVSAATQSAILRAMEPKKKQRYQSVGEMLANLSNLSAVPMPSDADVAPSGADVAPSDAVVAPSDPGAAPKYDTAPKDDTAVEDDTVAEETVVSGQLAGHEYVDLGLSVKWATCNVGANSPSDYGNYYAWGEISTKSTYTTDNSKTCGKDAFNRNIGGDASLDAARANWGGTWRLPTVGEFQELIDNCDWTWTTQGGHNGYKVTSKKKGYEGRSIFLPAAGWRYGSSLYYAGQYGYYWSSSPDGSGSSYARGLAFFSSGHNTDWNRRYHGFSVRPLSE